MAKTLFRRDAAETVRINAILGEEGTGALPQVSPGGEGGPPISLNSRPDSSPNISWASLQTDLEKTIQCIEAKENQKGSCAPKRRQAI